MTDIGTVTIVVPTFRRPTKLKRAVQSILSQTYHNLRILVFDNASEDGTREMVAELIAADPRVKYHCHRRNIGLIENLNYAFQSVQTPFFGILTDDDYFLPSFIEDAIAGFLNHPQIKVSILSAPVIKADGTFISDALASWPREGLFAPGESGLLSVRGSHPVLTMCLFRLELKAELQFDVITDSISDLPILISILAKYPVHLSKKIGGYFIRYDDASGNRFAKIDNVRVICPAYMRVEKILEMHLDVDVPLTAQILRHFRRRVDRLFFFLMLNNIMEQNAPCWRYMREIGAQRGPSVWHLGRLVLGLLTRVVNPALLGKCAKFFYQIIRHAKHGIRGK